MVMCALLFILTGSSLPLLPPPSLSSLPPSPQRMATQHKVPHHTSRMMISDMIRLANLSLQRTWRTVGREKSSAWTAIYGYATGQREG